MLRILTAVLMVLGAGCCAAEVAFVEEKGALQVRVDGRDFARYVYDDAVTLRPFFCDIVAPNGVRVTRNRPPVDGVDATDHADMHPGLWMAFGDINGVDFWRNKGRVEHLRFVEAPNTRDGVGRFAVENRYVDPQGTEVCREIARYAFAPQGAGVLISMSSTFTAWETAVTFGDQEEMGLGVRVATPLTIKAGGMILNSDAARDEAGVWGKTAAWCLYAGGSDVERAGVALFPHPENFGASWFHARDYGLLVANPFGRKAFTNGEASAVRIEPGKTLTLRFGVWIFAGASDGVEAVYKGYTDEK